jgi:hypothetical protein
MVEAATATTRDLLRFLDADRAPADEPAAPAVDAAAPEAAP